MKIENSLVNKINMVAMGITEKGYTNLSKGTKIFIQCFEILEIEPKILVYAKEVLCYCTIFSAQQPIFLVECRLHCYMLLLKLKCGFKTCELDCMKILSK